jgi:oligopeptide transport system permease protein
MLRYVIGRLLGAVPTLFVIVTVAFFLIRVAPGGPFNLERPLPPQIMANLEAYYGLDQPLWQQYLSYLQGLVTLDLGPSYVYRDFTVDELLRQGLPVSIQLGGTALVLALVVGTALGTYAAVRQNTPGDVGVMAVAMIGITVPNFVMAPVLTLILAIWLGWLPAGGWGEGAVLNKILPVFTLALPQIAIIARLTRGSMIEVLRAHHIRTARANGLPPAVVTRRALRGALLPVVSYLGPAAAALLTGSVVIETIFGIPGIGRYFVQGALNRDYTLVMGTVVTVALFVVVFNLLVDLLYAVLDPKVRYD